MALLEHSLPNNNNGKINNKQKQKQKHKQNQKQKQKEKQGSSSSSSSSSWEQIKNLISCKQVEGSRVHDPSSSKTMMGSSCSSICSFRDVVHGNTRVVHRADNSSPESSSLGQETGLLSRKPAVSTAAKSSRRSSSSSSGKSNGGATYTSSSSRGMQFRKLSGCYECHMIIDPSRLPIPRSSVCACSQCGEVFPKMESLELHQAVRHAVWELGPEDSGRNIVEIIFKSSWLKKDNSICKIERILKVQNSQRTIQRFEECRESVKSRAVTSSKKNPRCAADGNELLRFHCSTLSCPLGAQGSTALCSAIPGCGVCSIIRHGFQGGKGVMTTASSGMAHDSSVAAPRAMLVCRVIAGRVRRVPEEDGLYDSVAGCAGLYSNLEELLVFNPRAILPCFVVVYKVLSS